ncbi:MAG: hypothetical protein N838_06045 [Thiohalocapsa sp. PB-PSB1]|nr:MAG: hypothetical protein N838_06045 [Thiohalocapsa sp. PB-PSB1]
MKKAKLNTLGSGLFGSSLNASASMTYFLAAVAGFQIIDAELRAVISKFTDENLR